MLVGTALSHLREKGLFTDVVFTIGDCKLKAHRLVLSASSMVFESMLYPILPDGTLNLRHEGNCPLEISLSEETDASLFCTLLECIYDDNFQVPTSQIPGLLKLSKKYDVSKVALLCRDAMRASITTDNAWQVYVLGPTEYNDPLLALDIIAENATELMQQPQFLTLPEERLLTFLRCDSLLVEEVKVFEGTLAWGREELKRRQESKEASDTLTLKSVLKNAIPLVRLPLLSLHEIAAKVAPADVLDLHLLTQLFTYAALNEHARKEPLPDSMRDFSCTPRESPTSLSPPRCQLLHDMPLCSYRAGPHNAAGYESGWLCDICGTDCSKLLDKSRYHCSTCKADICQKCHSRTHRPPKDSKGHEMRLSGYSEGRHNRKGYKKGWICDHCKLSSTLSSTSKKLKEHRYWCDECSADVCLDCAWKTDRK
eukprot:gb/GEZN01007526.1/.p1 GENE.gb/GEZN01007526.1/~~gb/GEZN01007526.1/.p1  ORF type:complete len:426 (-),score=27.07 gb/GEZN01007526.1/:207-1484(-)